MQEFNSTYGISVNQLIHSQIVHAVSVLLIIFLVHYIALCGLIQLLKNTAINGTHNLN